MSGTPGTPADYREGLIVDHPKMPDWGPGRILAVNGTKVTVYFRDLPGDQAKDAIRVIETRYVELGQAASQSDPFLAHHLVVRMGLFLKEGRELSEEHRIFLGDALLSISGGMSAKDAFHLKAQGRSTELDRDMNMALEFAARLPNEPKEGIIVKDLADRYHREESTIRKTVKRLYPQAQGALENLRAKYRYHQQRATGENP